MGGRAVEAGGPGRGPRRAGGAPGGAMTSLAVVEDYPTGLLKVRWADGLDLLRRLSANALIDLQPGQVRGTLFVTEKARIVDVVTVAVFEDQLFLLSSPGNEETIASWIEKYHFTEDAGVRVVTSAFAVTSVGGPDAHSRTAELSANFVSCPWNLEPYENESYRGAS